MLEVRRAEYAYRDEPVLTGASLTVRGGEIVCVVGRNGAGKTTLLRLCAGFLSPRAGSVRCFGVDPATAPRHTIAPRVSYLSQDYRLAFPFTVSEVVLMGRYAHRQRSWFRLESDADVALADAAMARCDVLQLAGRRFDHISGGEQRLVLLAQALCQGAELILLDEPTASLDPAHAIAVFDSLIQATTPNPDAPTDAEPAAAVVVTHDLNLAARFATRIAVVDDGRITADGAPAEVLGSEAIRGAFDVDLHVGQLPGGGPTFAVPR